MTDEKPKKKGRGPAYFTMDFGDTRPVRVTIEPDGLVKFRPLYSRDVFAAKLGRLYVYAAQVFAEAKKRERKLARQLARS